MTDCVRQLKPRIRFEKETSRGRIQTSYMYDVILVNQIQRCENSVNQSIIHEDVHACTFYVRAWADALRN